MPCTASSSQPQAQSNVPVPVGIAPMPPTLEPGPLCAERAAKLLVVPVLWVSAPIDHFDDRILRASRGRSVPSMPGPSSCRSAGDIIVQSTKTLHDKRVNHNFATLALPPSHLCWTLSPVPQFRLSSWHPSTIDALFAVMGHGERMLKLVFSNIFILFCPIFPELAPWPRNQRRRRGVPPSRPGQRRRPSSAKLLYAFPGREPWLRASVPG